MANCARPAHRSVLARYPLHLPISDTARQHEATARCWPVLAQWRVDAIMVSSLIGHDLQVLAMACPPSGCATTITRCGRNCTVIW